MKCPLCLPHPIGQRRRRSSVNQSATRQQRALPKTIQNLAYNTYTDTYIHIHTLSAWVDEAYLRWCRLATAEFVVTDTVTICSKAWQEWQGMKREGVPKLTMGIAAE